MIEAESLTKWYGPTRALDAVSLKIEPGQIVGFLGPNGAGKSTTLRILTGYLPPTSGTAKVAGHDMLREAEQARAKIGYLPESTPLYPEMRVEEYLDYRGRLMEMDRARRRARIDEVCARCGLAHNRRRLIGQLSRGNRQRVGLAQALLHEPPVLILDEPTAGLDPNQIGEVRSMIRELGGRQTILLSTHILPEVEKTADRVVIIAGGRIVADGTPDELRQRVGGGARIAVEVKGEAEQVRGALSAVADVDGVEAESTGDDGWVRAWVTPRAASPIVRERLGQTIASRGWPLRRLEDERATLEAFFVKITAEQDAGVVRSEAAA